MVPTDTSTHASPTRNVGIFPIVEILDFAGGRRRLSTI